MGSGYDFSDCSDVIEEQREAARQAEDWANLDEKSISREINGINSRVTSCVLQLAKMISENDYKKTKDMLEALLAKDLVDGWMDHFRDANREFLAFEKRAEMKKNLKPEEQKKYDAACKFYEDMYFLLLVGADIYNLIRMVPLEEGFRIIRLKDNFEEAGFDVDLYNRIDKELERINMLLNYSWDQLEKSAHGSRAFVDNNLGKFERKEMEKKYREYRMKDYQRFATSHGFMVSFTCTPDGHFYPKPDILAMTGIIDNYTARIAQTLEIDGRLQATIKECKKAREGAVADAEKNCVTQAGQFLCSAFDELIKAIADFAETALDVYTNFKEGKSIAPYCFMKKLSSMSSVQPKYDFMPNTGDPWDSGTYYRDIYTEAALALGAQARLFTFDHGTTFY